MRFAFKEALFGFLYVALMFLISGVGVLFIGTFNPFVKLFYWKHLFFMATVGFFLTGILFGALLK